VELTHACPRVLTSDHKARHYGRMILSTHYWWVGFVAEAIALTDAGRFCYRWLFPAILNLKLKPVQGYHCWLRPASSQPKGTTKKHPTVLKLRSLVPFLWESARKIRRFRIFFRLIAQKSISPDRRCSISKPMKPINAPCHDGPDTWPCVRVGY
jgi:hypothetical protein